MPFFANMPDDLLTMEWLTTEIMQESSSLIWTMLLPCRGNHGGQLMHGGHGLRISSLGAIASQSVSYDQFSFCMPCGTLGNVQLHLL